MRDLDRREFLAGVAGGVAVAAAPAGATPAIEGAAPATTAPAPAGGLVEPEFRPLPIGAIRPAGWLARQLRIQADGLTGHLDLFWPDVGQSQWFGGAAEGWERAPYWLDGAIPLAWILDDAPLKARVARYVDHIVTHQRADGWYAPTPLTPPRSGTTCGPSSSSTRRSSSTTRRRATRGSSRPSCGASGPWRPASTARRSTSGAASAGTRGSCRPSTPTSARASRGSSTSRASCGGRASTSRPSTEPTTSRCRRRVAASGSGRSTS